MIIFRTPGLQFPKPEKKSQNNIAGPQLCVFRCFLFFPKTVEEVIHLENLFDPYRPKRPLVVADVD